MVRVVSLGSTGKCILYVCRLLAKTFVIMQGEEWMDSRKSRYGSIQLGETPERESAGTELILGLRLRSLSSFINSTTFPS